MKARCKTGFVVLFHVVAFGAGMCEAAELSGHSGYNAPTLPKSGRKKGEQEAQNAACSEQYSKVINLLPFENLCPHACICGCPLTTPPKA
eukprot:1159843-Pelagomonas_calceolata.AAC.6